MLVSYLKFLVLKTDFNIHTKFPIFTESKHEIEIVSVQNKLFLYLDMNQKDINYIK